jgi:hypothetical protein
MGIFRRFRAPVFAAPTARSAYSLAHRFLLQARVPMNGRDLLAVLLMIVPSIALIAAVAFSLIPAASSGADTARVEHAKAGEVARRH